MVSPSPKLYEDTASGQKIAKYTKSNHLNYIENITFTCIKVYDKSLFNALFSEDNFNVGIVDKFSVFNLIFFILEEVFNVFNGFLVIIAHII